MRDCPRLTETCSEITPHFSVQARGILSLSKEPPRAPLRLDRAFGPSLRPKARQSRLTQAALGPMQPLLARYPLDYVLAHPHEIAIIGDPDTSDTRALLDVCATGYHPHQIVALVAPDAESSAVPLLQHRSHVEGHATAYVCVDFTCRALVTDPTARRHC